jgi:hypothetical protein
MPEIGTSYTSVQTFKTEATYCCKACGFTSPVKVRGVGQVTANAYHRLGNHASAREAARRGAEHAARADVSHRMGLVPCPSCKKRDPAGVRRFIFEHVAKLGGALIIASFAAALFSRGPLGAFVILALTVVVYFWLFDPRWAWSNASCFVTFPGSEPSPEQRAKTVAAWRSELEKTIAERKLFYSPEARARVMACDDPETVSRWCVQLILSRDPLDKVVGVSQGSPR